jgi:hypothetical protein
MQSWDDAYLRHDVLEEVNEPVYFHEFVERCRHHRLRYLGEAEFHTMVGDNLPPAIAQTLRRLTTDIIQTEQYMDFVRNRTFRQTLLCRQDLQLERRVVGARLAGMWVSAPLQVESAEGSTDSLPAIFRHPTGGTIKAGRRIIRAALAQLSSIWPASVSVPELLEMALRHPDARMETGFDPAAALQNTLLECFSRGMVDLSALPMTCARRPGRCPLASPLARAQAERSLLITSMRHEMVQVEPIHAFILRLLDGSRDRAALLDLMIAAAMDGTLTLRDGGQPIRDRQRLAPLLGDVLESSLDRLASAALIMR